MPATAATWRWTGLDASSSAWSRPQNWDVLSAPVNDGTAALVFDSNPPSPRHDPLVDLPWELDTIELRGDDPYSITGAPLELRGGIVVRQSVLLSLQHQLANDVLLLDDNVWSTESSGGTLSCTGAVNLGSHRLQLTPEGGTALSLAGSMSGSGGLVVNGAGTLRLSGSNTYSGGTTLVFGNIQVSSTNAIPPGNVVLESGILNVGSSGNVLGPGASTLPGLVLGGVPGGSVSVNGNPLQISSLGDWIVYDSTGEPSEMMITGTLDLASASGSRILRIDDSPFTTEELTILAGIVNPVSIPGSAAAIRKRGGGGLLLGGINTFGRALQVEEGPVLLLRPEALGAAGPGDPTVVFAGAALELASSFTVPNETLRLNGTGLSGTGALHSRGGSHSWGGPVLLVSDAAIGVVAGGSGLRITGPVSGSGSLTKVGDGALVLTAANAYQGSTVVAAGVLRADNTAGDAVPAAVTVAAGGTLAGDGSVGGVVTVQTGGKIDPSSFGPATSSLVAQGITFLPSSTLHLALVSNGNNARLDLLGTATFAGRLELEAVPPRTPGLGDAFTLVHFASSIGHFTDLALPPLGGGLQWSLVYGPNALVARVANPTDAVGPVARRTALLDAAPNPFGAHTRIRYEIAHPAQARLEVLDVAGRVLNRLTDGPAGAGSFEIDWTGVTAAGTRASNGVYFLRLRVDGRVVRPMRRLVFVR